MQPSTRVSFIPKTNTRSSSASDMALQSSRKKPKLLRKLTKVVILLQIFCLVVRTNGSPAPLTPLPEEALKVGKGWQDAKSGAEAAKTLSIGKKDEVLDTFTRNQQVLEDQDNRLLGLRLVSAEAEKGSETLRMDFRAALVRDMKSHGPEAEKWLKELPPPEKASGHIKDEWVKLKSEALKDYKLDQGGTWWDHFIALMRAIFRPWKWIDAKLDEKFLKLRMLKGFKASKHDLIVLELDNVRKAGILLSKEEFALVHRLVEVGGDESKLTEAEFKLIEKLAGKTVAQRRLETLSSIRLHIEQLLTVPVTSAEAKVRDAKVSQLKAALEALQDNTARGINWTKEQTKLVVALEKLKDIGKLDSTLSKASRRTLTSLVDEETTIRQAELYEKAIHRLAAKKGTALDPQDVILEKMLFERLEGASRGSTVGLAIKFNEKQNKRILKLAADYDTQMGYIKLHTNPEAIDISDASLLHYELPVDRRAERVLQRMQKQGPLSPEQDQLLKRLQQNSKKARFATPRTTTLAKQFDRSIKEMKEEDKINALLSFDRKILNHDATLIHGGASNKDLIAPEIVGGQVAKERSRYLVSISNEIAYSMPPEEKALYYLLSKEENGARLDQQEMDLKGTISKTNPLTPEDRFLAVVYAKRYDEPTLEKLAHEQLLSLEHAGLRLTREAKDLAKKLGDKNFLEISEKESKTIRKLAKDNIVISKLKKGHGAQQAALFFMGELPREKVPLPRILAQLKPDELARAKQLIVSGHKAERWVHDPRVMELVNLGQKADKRMTLDMKTTDLRSLELLMKSQHDLRAKEISELEKKFKVETETLKAFAEVLKRHSIKPAEESELPEDLQRFLDQGSHLEGSQTGKP